MTKCSRHRAVGGNSSAGCIGRLAPVFAEEIHHHPAGVGTGSSIEFERRIASAPGMPQTSNSYYTQQEFAVHAIVADFLGVAASAACNGLDGQARSCGGGAFYLAGAIAGRDGSGRTTRSATLWIRMAGGRLGMCFRGACRGRLCDHCCRTGPCAAFHMLALTW